MHKKKYVKIHEFAALCHTSKDTLLHYDKKNLLKPKITAENGYRYYDIEQFFRYDLITVLKDTGSTLEEIKSYLNNSPADMVQIIRERINLLQKEQEILVRKISMLETLTDLTAQALQTNYDTLFFEEQQKETVRLLPIHSQSINTPHSLAVCYSDCLLKCLTHGNNVDPPLGMVIEKQNIFKKKFNVQYLFTRNLEHCSVKTKSISKGTYACFLHKGSIQSHETAFLNFIEKIAQKQLSPKSDVFLYSQMNYLIDEHSDEIILKYAVKTA